MNRQQANTIRKYMSDNVFALVELTGYSEDDAFAKFWHESAFNSDGELMYSEPDQSLVIQDDADEYGLSDIPKDLRSALLALADEHDVIGIDSITQLVRELRE